MTAFVAPLLSVALAGLTAVAPTHHPRPEADPPAKVVQPTPPAPTLKVGDKAPALRADRWLQGDEVKGFEAGKVYVVEFWQTWCGPCISAMPHLADLAEEYKPKGVTVVGFAGVKGNDTTEGVEEFVRKKGPKLGYTFAHSPDEEMTNAWMTAAGRSGIPCSFVVDQRGRIAYIGHPMSLDPVLPKVLAGTWDGSKEQEVLAAHRRDVSNVFSAAARAKTPSEAVEALKTLAALTAEKPEVAGARGVAVTRLELLLRAGQFAEAAAATDALIAKSVKRDDPSGLNGLVLSLTAGKPGPEAGRLAVKAADAGLKLAGDTSVPALLSANSAYAAAGQTDKAKEFVAGAIGLAEKAVKGDTDWRGNLTLAEVYKAAGEAGKAKAAAQKVFDHAPKGMPPYLVEELKQYGAEPKKGDDR